MEETRTFVFFIFPCHNQTIYYSNSYPTQASGGAGYQRRENPYAQQDSRAYEMAEVRDSRTQLSPEGDNMSAFYREVGMLFPFCFRSCFEFDHW